MKSIFKIKTNQKLRPFGPSSLRASRGFTFIELIVVVAIMTLISTVVLFRQAKFSSDILITDMAYQIALAIRQAEVYGISSKGADTESEQNSFKSGYGVLFTPILAKGELSENGESAFAMFLDIPNASSINVGQDTNFNYVYDPGLDVLLEPYPVRLTQGQKIRGYCGHFPSTGQWQCWSYASPVLDSSARVLTISFVKPNPDAHIFIGTIGSSNSYLYNNQVYDKAKIIIESALGDKCRSVTVDSSGAIGVDAIDPTDTQNGCTGGGILETE